MEIDCCQHIKIHTPSNVFNSLPQTELAKYNAVLEIKTNTEPNGWMNLDVLYEAEDTITVYILLHALYKADENAETEISWRDSTYLITDSGLHKRIIGQNGGMGCDEYIIQHTLKEFVHENKIKSLSHLGKVMDLPFSMFYNFDELDQLIDLRILHNGRLTVTGNTLELKRYNELVFSNRHIKTNIEIKNSNRIEFINCFIEADITCFEVNNVEFTNCIFAGKLSCSHCSTVIVDSCNVKELLFSINRLSMLKITWCKIFELYFFDSDVPHLAAYKNHINKISISASNLHDNKITISQLRESNVTLFNYFCKKSCPSEKWYLTFNSDEPIKSISKKTHMLDTIDALLTNCDFEYRQKEKCNLKYKKMLYSNHGLRKLFIFITGGYYKPFRWIVYFALVSILFTFIYTSPYCLFSDGSDALRQGLPLLTATYYSVLQMIGTSVEKIAPQGLSAILSTIQASLNTILMANFFTAVIKKYVD